MPIIFGHNNGMNQYDDNGTVLTMDSELSGWSSASNDATTVDKVAKRMEKLITSSITEEEKQRLRDIFDAKSSADDDGGQAS